VTDASAVKPHDIAAGEIDGWRGRCLNLFAKAERAVAVTLEALADRNASLAIKHLAGHRMADLTKLAAAEVGATEKQSKALLAALDAWPVLESKRTYLAHGVSTALLDKHGAWQARFDFTGYRPNKCERLSWTCSKQEALEFESQLEREFKLLSGQLGHFRKRLPT
jgi:hypothetical protein